MVNGRIKLIFLLCCFSLSLFSQSRLNIELDNFNRCNVQIDLNQQFDQINYFLPFAINENSEIINNDQSIINIIKIGNKYTWLHIVKEFSDTTFFQIINIPIIKNYENTDNAIIELYPSFKVLDVMDKNIYEQSIHKLKSMTIKTPDTYNEKEFKTNNFKKIDDFTYNYEKENDNETWLVIPSPIAKSTADWSAFVGLLIGIMFLIIAKPSLKNIKLIWSIVYLIGVILLILVFIFAIKNGI